MDILIGTVCLVLCLIALVAILNVLTYPRLIKRESVGQCPSVSVLIPARNEGERLGATLNGWMSQSYPNYEVVVLDDQSDDGTLEVARKFEGGRVQVRVGESLPAGGWTGKNWACHQLTLAARGDLLLFTDADVFWKPEALAALVAESLARRADLLSVFPQQITKSWAERLVVPLVGFAVFSYLPVLAVHHIHWQSLSAAIGQCMLFRREAYLAVGGHERRKNSLTEDLSFGREIQRRKMRLRLADGGGLMVTQMYSNWGEVRDGFGKNILAGHAGSIPFLLASTGFHWLVFIFPWLWMCYDLMQGALLVGLGVVTRALTAASTQQRVLDAVMMPISVGAMTLIAIRAIQWDLRGRVMWKGRPIGRKKAGGIKVE